MRHIRTCAACEGEEIPVPVCSQVSEKVRSGWSRTARALLDREKMPSRGTISWMKNQWSAMNCELKIVLEWCTSSCPCACDFSCRSYYVGSSNVSSIWSIPIYRQAIPPLIRRAHLLYLKVDVVRLSTRDPRQKCPFFCIYFKAFLRVCSCFSFPNETPGQWLPVSMLPSIQQELNPSCLSQLSLNQVNRTLECFQAPSGMP